MTAHKLTQTQLAQKAGVPIGSLKRWLNTPTWPQAYEAFAIARALGSSLDYLISGVKPQPKPAVLYEPQADRRGVVVAERCTDDIVTIPILDQKVAAGHGQELLPAYEAIGRLPFLRRLLRGEKPEDARALEVRGDSMTGIQMFDGDLVVFVPGLIRGDGLYVLRVGDTMKVKRVEFDDISRKIRIMSENPRYPDVVESADGQMVVVEGKVLGWVHAHPY